MGFLACAERHELAGINGAGWLVVVSDGTAIRALGWGPSSGGREPAR